MPVIFPNLSEGVISAGWAITVAHFVGPLRGGVGGPPHAIDPDFFTYATLYYHGLPAFLQ
jgi:hypothetical protein